MQLVGSSNPGDVDRDTAVRLLTQRAVLTRAVCRELIEADDWLDNRRPFTALGLLLQWVQQNLPESIRIEPHPSDGLDRMVVPDNCRDLFQEIRAGAEVGEALFMLLTADTMHQVAGDTKRIHESLKVYWANQPTAAPAPSVISCWSCFPTGEKKKS